MVARGHVVAVGIAYKYLVHLGMAYRLTVFVLEKILFGNIGDVFGFLILGEKMIKWLVAARTNFIGDRFVPFLGVRKFRIDIKNHATKRKYPVAHKLADRKLCRVDGGSCQSWK